MDDALEQRMGTMRARLSRLSHSIEQHDRVEPRRSTFDYPYCTGESPVADESGTVSSAFRGGVGVAGTAGGEAMLLRERDVNEATHSNTKISRKDAVPPVSKHGAHHPTPTVQAAPSGMHTMLQLARQHALASSTTARLSCTSPTLKGSTVVQLPPEENRPVPSVLPARVTVPKPNPVHFADPAAVHASERPWTYPRHLSASVSSTHQHENVTWTLPSHSEGPVKPRVCSNSTKDSDVDLGEGAEDPTFDAFRVVRARLRKKMRELATCKVDLPPVPSMASERNGSRSGSEGTLDASPGGAVTSKDRVYTEEESESPPPRSPPQIRSETVTPARDQESEPSSSKEGNIAGAFGARLWHEDETDPSVEVEVLPVSIKHVEGNDERLNVPAIDYSTGSEKAPPRPSHSGKAPSVTSTATLMEAHPSSGGMALKAPALIDRVRLHQDLRSPVSSAMSDSFNDVAPPFCRRESTLIDKRGWDDDDDEMHLQAGELMDNHPGVRPRGRMRAQGADEAVLSHGGVRRSKANIAPRRTDSLSRSGTAARSCTREGSRSTNTGSHRSSVKGGSRPRPISLNVEATVLCAVTGAELFALLRMRGLIESEGDTEEYRLPPARCHRLYVTHEEYRQLQLLRRSLRSLEEQEVNPKLPSYQRPTVSARSRNAEYTPPPPVLHCMQP